MALVCCSPLKVSYSIRNIPLTITAHWPRTIETQRCYEDTKHRGGFATVIAVLNSWEAADVASRNLRLFDPKGSATRVNTQYDTALRCGRSCK